MLNLSKYTTLRSISLVTQKVYFEYKNKLDTLKKKVHFLQRVGNF